MGGVIVVVGFFIAWANAPFAVAAGIALLFTLLQVTGVLGLIAGGGDHDADADADADGGGAHEHDADGGHAHEHDGEDEGGGRGLEHAFASPLGFGKVPFSVIWQTYAIVFAVTGFALNARYVDHAGGPPLVSLAWSVPASLAVGYAAVAILARLLGPVFATKAQEATSRADLVGQMGVVISSAVDSEFGEVRIRDKTGHDIRVICKLAKGGKRVRVAEHESVVIVDYEPTRGELLVAPFDDDDDDDDDDDEDDASTTKAAPGKSRTR